jgi:hypothetical protein
MSLNSGTTISGAGLSLPLLAAGRYAEWRPRMETTLMRAGIAVRDYKVENPDWAALVEAVEMWESADEESSIAYALGRKSASATSAGTAGPSPVEKEARRAAMEAVARGKRTYTMLYQTLPDELRLLVAHLPQGYAFGLWSWLEKRYQSTEQDNVGDLWDQFTAMYQADDETFDEYKARVDSVHRLLTHAKDKPSAGLYAHRVLWKLSSRYRPAVLALKASGKLKEAEKIDWNEIVAFINNHERSEERLAGADANGSSALSMAATSSYGRRGGRGGFDGASALECYNCGEKGHIARYCKRPSTRRTVWPGEHKKKYDDDGDDGGTGTSTGPGRSNRRSIVRGGGGSVQHASAAMMAALTSESDDDDEDARGHVSYSAMVMAPKESPRVEDNRGSQKPSGRSAHRPRGAPKKRPGPSPVVSALNF